MRAHHMLRPVRIVGPKCIEQFTMMVVAAVVSLWRIVVDGLEYDGKNDENVSRRECIAGIGALRDAAVKLRVQFREGRHCLGVTRAAVQGDRLHFGAELSKPPDLRVRQAGCGPAGDKGLDRRPQVVHAFNIEGLPVDDTCPTVRDDLHKALGLQAPQTLANRCAAEPVLLGQLCLGETATAREDAGDNVVTQQLIGTVGCPF